MIKKLITTAVLVIATITTSQAATFQWGSNGTAARFLIDAAGGTGSANRLATGSLVVLIKMTDATVTFDDTKTSYSAADSGITGGTIMTSTTLSGKGSITEDFGGSSYPYTSLNGNYAILFFDVGSWDAITAGTKYGLTTAVSPVALASEVDQTGAAKLTSNVGLTGTIAAVPEPATASLALAGLALLLKRRRA